MGLGGYVDREEGRSRRKRTLSGYLVRCETAEARRIVEEFRIEYEKEYGLTDITRHYTSMLPIREQEWLMTVAPRHYFAGLPPFLQALIRRNLREGAKEGNLDDHSPQLVQMLLRRDLKLNDSGDLQR